MSLLDTPLRDINTSEQLAEIRKELKEWKPTPSDLDGLRAWWQEACAPPYFPTPIDLTELMFGHLQWDAHRMLLEHMPSGRLWQQMGQYGKHYNLAGFWLAHAIKDGEHKIVHRLATDMVKGEDERANLVCLVSDQIKIWGHVRLNQDTIDVLNECMPILIWTTTNAFVNTLNDACVSIEQIRSNPEQGLTQGPMILQEAKAAALKKILNPAVFFSNATKQGFVEEHLLEALARTDQSIDVWLDRMPEQIKASFHKTMQQLLDDQNMSPIVRQGAPIAVSLHENVDMSHNLGGHCGASNPVKKL